MRLDTRIAIIILSTLILNSMDRQVNVWFPKKFTYILITSSICRMTRQRADTGVSRLNKLYNTNKCISYLLAPLMDSL